MAVSLLYVNSPKSPAAACIILYEIKKKQQLIARKEKNKYRLN